MAISTIRRASQEDFDAVQAAWERFCERHGELRLDMNHPGDFSYDPDIPEISYYKALWQRIIFRALGLSGRVDIKHPVCIAYDHVGRSGY